MNKQLTTPSKQVLNNCNFGYVSRPRTAEDRYIKSADTRVRAIDDSLVAGQVSAYRQSLLSELDNQIHDVLPRLQKNGDEMSFVIQPENNSRPYLDAWFIGASIANTEIVLDETQLVDAYAIDEQGNLLRYKALELGWNNVPEGPYQNIWQGSLPTEVARQAVAIIPTLGWKKKASL